MKRVYRIGLIGLAATSLIAFVILYKLLSSPSLEAYTSLQTPSAPTSAPINALFMGTTTILFDDGKTRILSDGFFSRPPIWRLLIGKIPPDERLIDGALSKAGIKGLDAIFVAHSHHDHAMDTARVALKTGAVVFGSPSTRNVVLGDGLPSDRITVFEDGTSYTLGDYTVTVFQTPHSPGVAFPGTVDQPLAVPASASEYREGGNFSFRIQRHSIGILLVASGNFIPGKFKVVKSDTVFLGIGGLGKQSQAFISDYWREVVQAVGAKVVIPVHWDDFTRSHDEPLRPMPYALDDFDNSMKALLALAKRDNVQVRLPVAFETFGVN
ncbi:MAG: MBL fold metallo-hydrolase [Hyphomicrobium sp.]